MTKLPISLRPDVPNCIWCLEPIIHTYTGGPGSVRSSDYYSSYYRCYNHLQDIVYIINYNNEFWYLQTINVYVTNKIRINYFSYPQNPNIPNTIEHNLTISLQQIEDLKDLNKYYWETILNLPNYTNSHLFNLNYDDLISKVKGYLPFL